MVFGALFTNTAFWATLAAWLLAQVIKLPLDFVLTRKVHWHLLLSPGGMPSSHSALVTAAAITIGLQDGFNSTAFTIAFVVAMIVIYDATGVRRAAGNNARVINRMIDDLIAHGHPLREEQLREVLGHTPREVIAGAIFGALVGGFFWWLFRATF